jgi:hypothetical protein
MIESEAFSFVATALRAGINGFNHSHGQIILIIKHASSNFIFFEALPLFLNVSRESPGSAKQAGEG